MTRKIIVNTRRQRAAMEHFYGVFFEDISNAGDGGLYAEMIRNRSFEFCPMDDPKYNALTAWEPVMENGSRISFYISDQEPLTPQNPHYLVMSFERISGKAGIRNHGFYTGIPMAKGEEYSLSFYARATSPLPIYVGIEAADGTFYKRKELVIHSSKWEKYEWNFSSEVTDSTCRFMIGAEKEGKLFLDFVSLFPVNTYRNRKNGLRKDLVGMIEDLKPRFVRFPGGCVVHVGTLNENDRNSMYRWKKTLGPVEERPVKSIQWRGNQSFGVGFMEFFQFCEDVGAEPVPVLPAGYNPHTGEAAPLDEMQPWIDDALDLIEFANGGVETKWGAVRAKLGHPNPFQLKYLSIGNEEEGEGFWDRYDLIHRAVRRRYPDIKLINTASFSPDGENYERGWANAIKNHSDLVDEHYYMVPEWFLQNCHRYDDFDRKGPGVFLGEYSSAGNTWFHALAEAAYMVHLEENADLVKLVCYAPLLCNIHNNQWSANLIYFDQSRAYGTPNYYVQKLFMNHCGTKLLEIKTEGEITKVPVTLPGEAPELPDNAPKDQRAAASNTVCVEDLHICAALDEEDGSIIVKVVNISDSDVHCEIFFENCQKLSGTIYKMSGFEKDAQNSLDEPFAVFPVEHAFSTDGNSVMHTFEASGITVFRLINIPG